MFREAVLAFLCGPDDGKPKETPEQKYCRACRAAKKDDCDNCDRDIKRIEPKGIQPRRHGGTEKSKT